MFGTGAHRPRHPSPTSLTCMYTPFLKAAVIGAGTMGAQIAAHLANAGLRVDLLDLPAPDGMPSNAVVQRAFRAAERLRPVPLHTRKVADRVTVGNTKDDYGRLATADWVIEAVVERLDVKRQVMRRIAEVVREDAVVSTNTSGIRVKEIVQGLPDDFRRRVLGTHFFNPPRYLKLLELIPTEDTDPAILRRISWFGRVHLGKGIVVANDVPYFIGNRIGMFGMIGAIGYVESGAYSIEEIDILTGPLVGRPKSGTFRTADVVGLDVLHLALQNLYQCVQHDESRERFQTPPLLEKLVSGGSLGAKTRAGFYRKVGRSILSVDPETMEYTPPAPMALGNLETLRASGGLEARMRVLFADEGRAGQFFRASVLDTMAYAARRIGEVTDRPARVDKAMRWGFGWKRGPFEVWDTLGFHRVLDEMDTLQLVVPDWVRSLARQPDPTFYGAARTTTFIPGIRSYEKIAKPDDELDIASMPKVWSNSEVALRDMGDGVALLEFQSKANTLGRDVIQGLLTSIDKVESDGWHGLVIGNTGTHFSAGANLKEMAHALQQRDFELIDRYIAAFQHAMLRVTYSSRPVVVATHQRALGGGCELVMSSGHPVAAAESYLGLVELAVGLIPAGTGSMRLARRAAALSSGHDSDLQAFLNRSFETVAKATVATSARQAQEHGFLPPHTVVIMHEDRRFHVAKQEILRLSMQGYMPPVPSGIRVLGRPGAAVLQVGVYQMRQGKFISDYDLHLAGKLAYVLTGGDLTGPQDVSEQYLLDLEREVFLGLLGQPKTQERIQSLLTSNKPVRN